MPTAFPFASYTLRDSTTLSDSLTISRETLDDGTPVIRTLGSVTYRTLSCTFVPMTISDAQAMVTYLVDNRATEFDMLDTDALGAATYRGYIWSDVKISHESGILATVSFDFYGKRV